MARRNRVIYQSQALFIAPSSTGAQVSGVASGPELFASNATEFGPDSLDQFKSGISLLKKMDRIQNCNFNFTLNRQDINEFGKLARIDTLVTEPPTVGLDFSYYVTDGYNERLMGFNMTGLKAGVTDGLMSTGRLGAQSISGLLQDTQGNNYYILTVDDGEDVVGQSDTFDGTNSVVAIGNGFVTDYSFEAAVGGLPTATVTVEAFNIKTDYNVAKASNAVADAAGSFTNKMEYISGNSPAVNLFQTPATKFTDVEKAYKIDYSRHVPGIVNSDTLYNYTGFTTGTSTVSALRPGDITIEFPDTSGMSSISGDDSAHIQSFSFSIPLTRTILQRLGSVFGYTRVVDVPINMELNISAVVSELKDANLFDIMADTSELTFAVVLNDQNQTSPVPKMRYEIKGARLVSETYSEAIGDNQTVDITYTVQLGGANDTSAGVFMSGSYGTEQADAVVQKFFIPGTGRLD
tara:strand:+ start:160 stop:1551 length:1392 start_codon:yes stop_codon:yes gene_type:complete